MVAIDREPLHSLRQRQHAEPFMRHARSLGKIGLFVISLLLFILAITLMKEGARDLGPLVRDAFRVTNPVNALGFGWLFAYVVMSGSPVAAAALAFFDAGVIDQLSAFTMITGSRLGASFIVLLLGFLYVLRGRSRIASLSMGILSLTVTGVTHVIALPVGAALLATGMFNRWRLRGSALISVFEAIFDPIVALLLAFLPRWALFPIGFGIILVSFSLFDRCLPQMHLRESQMGRMSRFVFRPWIMFVLGALVTLLSMSVSVSLSILVPLNHRGLVRRENVIPYIMGAGITTFIDTLLAAVLLDNPEAVAVVLAEMAAVAAVSALILALFYGWFERAMLGFVAWVSADTRNLTIFVIAIVVIPLFLMLA